MAVPPLPKLLVPQTEATSKIAAQIDSGRKIRASVEVPPGIIGIFELPAPLLEAEKEAEKWAKFTIDLLKTLLTDLSIGSEFGDGEFLHYGGDQTANFLRWMDIRLTRLDSIRDRLPLFPLADKPVQTTAAPTQPRHQSKDIFIVHGHDDAAKHAVARFFERLGLRPIILHEQADKGRTVIEKFEAHAYVGFAVILLTPDDMGYPKAKPTETKPRARQNVVLELGFFLGKLGRHRVCALLKGDIELPTDYVGVLYTPMDDAGAWQYKLAKEIKETGIAVDLNKL